MVNHQKGKLKDWPKLFPISPTIEHSTQKRKNCRLSPPCLVAQRQVVQKHPPLLTTHSTTTQRKIGRKQIRDDGSSKRISLTSRKATSDWVCQTKELPKSTKPRSANAASLRATPVLCKSVCVQHSSYLSSSVFVFPASALERDWPLLFCLGR